MAAETEVVGGRSLLPSLGLDCPEVLGGPVDEFLVDGEQVPAGVLVVCLEVGVRVQLGWDVE